MKFEYSPLPSVKSKIVLAPLVPIIFRYQRREFSTFGLVDSGASSSIISTVIADALSIPWQSIPKSQGFTMSGSFLFHNFKDINAEIDGTLFVLDLKIVEGIAPYHCILGQQDFFHKAKITFEQYKREFDIAFRKYN